MATKLRNLKIRKVDFVDYGANPDAHITLYKRKDDTTEKEGHEMSVFERIGKSIMKVLGIEDPEDIEKMASTFGEAKAKTRVRRVFDTVWWDYQNALRESIESIIADAGLEEADKSDMLRQTLGEFSSTMVKALTDASAQIAIENSIIKSATDPRLELWETMRDELDGLIEKAKCKKSEDEDMDDVPDDSDPEEDMEDEGEEIDKAEGEFEMAIDKAKMTESERMILEDLEKRYGSKEEESANEDVNKGVHPEVAAELESLKKFKADAEQRLASAELNEMKTFAKKYEIIGKNADELAVKLVDMKKSGSYEDYVSVLDEQVDLVEKSGLFTEIGKKGTQSTDADAWTQITKKAEEIHAAEPAMSWNEAIDKACAMNPTLVQEYEKSRA